MMAKTYGIYGEGPISDPKDLAPALRRAIEVVKKGEPALLDSLRNRGRYEATKCIGGPPGLRCPRRPPEVDRAGPGTRADGGSH